MRHLVLIVLLAACGKDPVAPPPPPPPPPAIVKLIMAPDTGFWRGGALRLSGLVRAAVTDHGDTVTAPAVTWMLPSGFTRVGDSVFATREARGQLRAVFASVADSTTTTAVSDLSKRSWATERSCYNNPNSIRGVEDPPIGLDSLVYRSSAGTVAYQNGDWKDLRATLTVDYLAIRFWKDGLVDTATGIDVIPAAQDTANAKLYLQQVENLKMEADTPRVYRAQWVAGSTWCSGFVGGGSDFLLKEP